MSGIEFYLGNQGLPPDYFDHLALPDYTGFPTTSRVSNHSSRYPIPIHHEAPAFNYEVHRKAGRWMVVFKDGTTQEMLLDCTNRYQDDHGICAWINHKWVEITKEFEARVASSFPLSP